MSTYLQGYRKGLLSYIYGFRIIIIKAFPYADISITSTCDYRPEKDQMMDLMHILNSDGKKSELYSLSLIIKADISESLGVTITHGLSLTRHDVLRSVTTEEMWKIMHIIYKVL